MTHFSPKNRQWKNREHSVMFFSFYSFSLRSHFTDSDADKKGETGNGKSDFFIIWKVTLKKLKFIAVRLC